MTQATPIVENQTFPSARTDINTIYEAITKLQSGASAPPTTYANMWWYDDSTNILKQRNTANSAWINRARLVGTILVPIGSNTLAYADESDSCPTTDWLKAAQEGWERRAVTGAVSINLSTSEFMVTQTILNWAAADSQDSKTTDTSVIDWDAVNGRFEVKKAGEYLWGVRFRVRSQSTTAQLERARVDLKGYYGTFGTLGSDTAYSFAPTFDDFMTNETNDIITIGDEWRYEKTTTGTTEYVYPSLTITTTGSSLQRNIEGGKVWCKMIRRDE